MTERKPAWMTYESWIDKQIRELETPSGTENADPAQEANSRLLAEVRHDG